MNSNDFVELNKNLGHRVVYTQNHAWMFRNDKSVLSLPTLEDVFPSKIELNRLLSLGAKIVLFKTALPDKNCYEYVFTGDTYSIEHFESKIRNQIRKGLKDCTIADVTMDDMKVRGFNINLQILEKHHRTVDYLDDKAKWTNYITTLMQHKDVYIKGAYIDNGLAAYVIFINVGNKYYIYHPFMDKQYSASCPMNALLYTFINETLDRERTIDISYGLASYSEKSGLDKFKKGMLFRESECTRVVVVSNLTRLLINKHTHKLLKFLFRTKIIKESIITKFEYLLHNEKILDEYLRLFGACR
jgi:hypothetical protein